MRPEIRFSIGFSWSYFMAGLLTIIIFFLLQNPLFALETKWQGGDKSQLRLIAASTQWQGKQRLVAGIEIRLAPKWKTYWRSPGDSGIPPYFDWSRSENLDKAQVFYPVPSRFKDPIGTTIGYEKSVILPVILTAKNPAQPIKLHLKAQYAICHDLCVPVSSDQVLMIEQGADSRNEPLLSMALDTLPKPVLTASPEFGVQKVIAKFDDKKPKLRFVVHFPAGSDGGELFIEGPDNLYIPSPQLVDDKQKKNRFDFVVDLLKVDNPNSFKNIDLTCTIRSREKAIEQPCRVE